MKKIFSIILAMIALISITCINSSCKKVTCLSDTCVSFSADSAIQGITFNFTDTNAITTIVDQSITFTNCTPGATSYLWNFGDGTTATTSTVTHKFASEGVYTVTFTPSNSLGPGKTKTFIITVDYLGTWTFKGITYNATYLIGNVYGSSVTLTSDTSRYCANYPEMGLWFTTTPVAGIYTIPAGGGISGSSQLGIYFATLAANGLDYRPTGGNGVDQTATVSISNGKIHIFATGIEMVNQPWDSAKLDFDFYQRFP